MDINNLTLGQLKEITSMFQSSPIPVVPVSDPLEGKYVICRCYSAGVHAGYLVSQNGDNVLLRESRRLWNWKAQSGIALSGVATNGLASGCKIDSVVSLIRLTGVIETIVCADKAKETIQYA